MYEKIVNRVPAFLLPFLLFCERVKDREWLAIVSFYIFHTEWTEAKANGYKTWPHCCTQAGCWKHTHSQSCSCNCAWCRVANYVGR